MASHDYDDASFELTKLLGRGLGPRAQSALHALAGRGFETSPDAPVEDAPFLSLTSDQQEGLCAFFRLARERGLRTTPGPSPHLAFAWREDLLGVDHAAVEFIRETSAIRGKDRPAAWHFLRALRDAQHVTDLDVDFSDPDVLALLDDVLSRASRHLLDVGPRVEQVTWMRSALRRIYLGAQAAGLRTRPVPDVLTRRLQYGRTSRTSLIAKLPQSDQNWIVAITASLRGLSREQQAGMDDSVPGVKGARSIKRTLAQTNANGLMSNLASFLHHWDEEGCDLGMGLAKLLTPARIAIWAQQGHRPDGGRLARATIVSRRNRMQVLLRMAMRLKRPLVTEVRILAIEKEIARYAAEEPANMQSREKSAESDEFKWVPTLAQLRDGQEVLHEGLARAKQKYNEGASSRLTYWRALRDFTIAYCAFLCMWRVDTATTIDLSRAKRHQNTKKVRWPDGSIHIRFGARAKQSGDRTYHVKDLLIPGRAVDVIEELLRFEGRSIEAPLRLGEQKVLLHVGQKWGADELLDEDREVIPLFRLRPDQPAPLQYGGVRGALRRALCDMGWEAINPHTFRAAGAIHWRFVLGVSLAAIERLGLWFHEETLVKVYAFLNQADLDMELTDAAASESCDFQDLDNEMLNRALDEAQSEALKLRTGKRRANSDLDHTARALHRAFVEINRARHGRDWAPPVESKLTPDELRLVDEALKRDGGLRGLLKRDVLASHYASTDTERHLRETPSPALLTLRLLMRKTSHEPTPKRGDRAA